MKLFLVAVLYFTLGGIGMYFAYRLFESDHPWPAIFMLTAAFLVIPAEITAGKGK